MKKLKKIQQKNNHYMLKAIKYMAISLFLIFLFSNISYAKDRIAVAGNSIAANFAWFNQIDLCEKSCSMFTRHAVAGDGVNSSGFVEPVTFDGIDYFSGEGKYYIKNIIEDSSNYEYILFICGTNELLRNIWYNREYYDREDIIIWEYIENLKIYLDKINEGSKILLFTIPKVKFYSEKEETSRIKWNDAIKNLAKEYKNVVIEDFNELGAEYKDDIHFTEDSYKNLYQILIKKYDMHIE